MVVMTHAHIPSITLPIAGDYTALPQYIRDTFDDWMEQADAATNDDAYTKAMVKACLTIGIAVPDSIGIAVCNCLYDGCGCGAIFDTHLPGVVITANADPGCNLSALQCPDCGHDHPRPVQD
ncbi:hypothetical protein ACWC09_26630 [Streptomyces sp. NPDC001617]